MQVVEQSNGQKCFVSSPANEKATMNVGTDNVGVQTDETCIIATLKYPLASLSLSLSLSLSAEA